MRRFLIMFALLCVIGIGAYAEIQTDGVSTDPSSGLASTDIDTIAEFNAIITPDVVDLSSAQSLLNKTIGGDANTVKMLRHATDCTTFTGAVDGQYCWEQDADLLYVCETANVCDTAGEWDAIGTVSNALTANALSANPTDCTAGQFATTIAANGNLTCAAIADADVPDTITASNYCALTGCALAGASSITNNFTIGSTAALNWGSTGVATPDTFLYRDAANIIAQRNGTTAQEYRVYNIDNGANDEYGIFSWSLVGGRLDMGAWFSGTGVQRSLYLHSGGQFSFMFGGSEAFRLTGSNFFAVTDNNKTLGTSTERFSTSYSYTLDAQKLVNTKDANPVRIEGQTLLQLRPQANEPPAASFATMNTRNSHPTLRFNGNVCAIWSFVLPESYSGNGVTVDIWHVSTEVINDVDWDISMELIGTSLDIDADSFATAVSGDNNNNNAISGIPTKTSVALTSGAQMDSCVASELCRVRICRDDTGDLGGADTIDFIGGQIRETP